MTFKGFQTGFERWLGIPWVLNGDLVTGCDCWGLVRLVYAAEAGFVLTHPSEMTSAAAAASARRVAEVRELVLGEAMFVPAEGEPRDLDVLEMAIAGGAADHVGLVAGGMVLHSRRHMGSHRTAFVELPFPIISRWRLG